MFTPVECGGVGVPRGALPLVDSISTPGEACRTRSLNDGKRAIVRIGMGVVPFWLVSLPPP